MTGVLMKRGDMDTERHTGGCSVTVTAEIGVTRLEAKEGGLEQTLPPSPEMVDGTTRSKDSSLSILRETVKDREPAVLQSTGSQRVGHD